MLKLLAKNIANNIVLWLFCVWEARNKQVASDYTSTYKAGDDCTAYNPNIERLSLVGTQEHSE